MDSKGLSLMTGVENEIIMGKQYNKTIAIILLNLTYNLLFIYSTNIYSVPIVFHVIFYAKGRTTPNMSKDPALLDLHSDTHFNHWLLCAVDKCV